MKLTTLSLVTLLLNTSGTSLGFSFNAPLSTLSSCIATTTTRGTSIATFGIQPTTPPFRNGNDVVMTSSKANSHLSSASQDTFSILDDLSTTLSGPDLPPVPLTSKRLFLVRHGEVINPGGDRPVYYGSQDVKLSPLGELEAKAAGSYLKQFDLQYIAASPLTRAIYGAKEVLRRQLETDRDVKIFNGFTEMDRGEWAGKTIEEIGRDVMDRFDACDESVTPQGGESYPELKKRVLDARDELLAVTEDGRASAIVSHLQVTRCMLSDALGIPVNEMSKLKVATASITCIDYDAVTGEQKVHFQSFKPEAGLQKSGDGAN